MLKQLKALLGIGPSVDYRQLLMNGAIIVDVRTPEEFREGTIKGAKNIPLNTIGAQAETLLKTGKPIITVCRSGARSGMAASQLKKAGIEVYNGGPWRSLHQKLES